MFVRKHRIFVDLERFKATELRNLLLYTGKIVFKNIPEILIKIYLKYRLL